MRVSKQVSKSVWIRHCYIRNHFTIVRSYLLNYLVNDMNNEGQILVFQYFLSIYLYIHLIIRVRSPQLQHLTFSTCLGHLDQDTVHCQTVEHMSQGHTQDKMEAHHQVLLQEEETEHPRRKGQHHLQKPHPMVFHPHPRFTWAPVSLKCSTDVR